MEEIIEIVEVKSTKYVLLSVTEYETLNHQISEAMGFDVGQPTERYAPTEPSLAKINTQYDEEGNEIFDTIPVMPLMPSIQNSCADLLAGFELIESYVPYNISME